MNLPLPSIFLLLILSIAPAVKADKIIFTNGRTLECSIVQEHDSSYLISLGSGTMSIPKNKVQQAVRDSTTTTASASATPAPRKNILSEKHAPAEHKELVREFKSLMAKRNAAYDAKYMRNVYHGKIKQIEREINELNSRTRSKEKELQTVSKKINALKLPDAAPSRTAEIIAYNELINEKYKLYDLESAINAELVTMKQDAADLVRKSQQLHVQFKNELLPIPVFHKALHSFSSYYADYRNAHPVIEPDSDLSALLSKIDRYLVNFKNETKTVAVETKRDGDSIYVDVLINGSVTGVFLFDTGAEVMTITESFAKKLGISLELLPDSIAVVADGREVPVKQSELLSVALGESEVKNVEVLIVPDSPNHGDDGLLGMAFLKNFTFSMDGVSGKIELTKYSAEQE